MSTYQVLYWKHVPAQIKVHDDDRTISREMPKRFQSLIDQLAMAEGLVGSDEYLDQFRWGEKQERSGAPEEVIEKVIAELETQFKGVSGGGISA